MEACPCIPVTLWRRRQPLWVVVGGGDKGGILVREGESLSAPKVQGRLAVGALVEELRRCEVPGGHGPRLRYRKLAGDGPPSGWVSLQAPSGRALLEPAPPSTPLCDLWGWLRAWLCCRRPGALPAGAQPPPTHGTAPKPPRRRLLRLGRRRSSARPPTAEPGEATGEEKAAAEAKPFGSVGPWNVRGFCFFADFDSGNCAHVADAAAGDEDSDTLCFNVTVRADCDSSSCTASSKHSECQWFHFGMRGAFSPGQRLRFQVLGLSRFNHIEKASPGVGFLTDGLRPVACSDESREHWSFVAGESGVRALPDGRLAFAFEHVLPRKQKEAVQELFFATSFPYPLWRVGQCVESLGKARGPAVYLHKELLAESLQGRPVELLTISASVTAAGEKEEEEAQQRQPSLEGLQSRGERPLLFPGRQAIFISARVHPGETPASFVLEGLLGYLLSDHPVAAYLRSKYVFHVIPVLNPDGVELGHHRLDSRGENLNRVYGRASTSLHPSIHAAEAAIAAAHRHQGGLRLYLDLHAHSNRRGAFLLGDPGPGSRPEESVAARLFGYALARQCSSFEYCSSTFDGESLGTGKTGATALTGAALCFTLETNYGRGHHSPFPFVPDDWRHLGASCLRALLDLDLLEAPDPCATVHLPEELAGDLARAEAWLYGQAIGMAEEEEQPLAPELAPTRARPHFAEVMPPSPEHQPSSAAWVCSELMGTFVEIVEEQLKEGQRLCRLHECHGGYWLPEVDLKPLEAQPGRFFYGTLAQVPVSLKAEAGAPVAWRLPAGTVVEASERRVVDGVLRIQLVDKTLQGEAGWVSEYKSVAFDSRLGGRHQLLRLARPPRPARWEGLRRYVFAT